MDTKYRIDTEENRKFLGDALDDLLRFGRRFPSPGGSAYYLGDDGTPWKQYNRETYATARMAHVYSIGKMLGKKDCEDLIDQAVKGLTGELRDTEHGGWYSALRQDGSVEPGKLCYAHAFVILAATSTLLAGHPDAKKLLADAEEAYDKFFWDEKEGMSCDNWNTEFTERSTYRGLNANMHTVEAFLAVADAAGSDEYRKRAGRIIDHVVPWAEGNHWRIPEHYSDTWQILKEFNKEKPDDQFKPYGATPGHAIEWARLILQWALSTYKDDAEHLGKYVKASENLFNQAISDAWDADGAPGIVYTTDWEGKPVIHDRMHWVLAEAVNTSASLYRVTKNAKYADDFTMFMKYLDEDVIDHEHGSWYHQMDSKNRPTGTVWPGKPDLYHASQATLIPYYDASVSIAKAVKEERKA